MSFANAASDAKAGAEAYIRSLLDLLGDRHSLDVQEELLAALERATAGLGDELLRRPEAPGKWSILQVVQHLADNELVFSCRMRKILAEPEPMLESYDQDLWARQLDYNGGRLDEALARLRSLRMANLGLLRSLDDDQLNRAGFHAERGLESVRRIAQLIAAHDLVHRRQIERIKRALGVGGGGDE